jgi:hypothetical protein
MFVSTDGATVFNDAFGVDVSGHSAVESAFVSKGMTCHDGAVWNPSAPASNFRIGDACIPAYIGFWGMFSLSETDKFPQQKPGRWIETDTYAGIDFARPLGWDEHVSLKTWWLRWHFPATGRRSTDMCAIDATLKDVPLHPTTSWRYRFHGASRGRVEIKFGVSEDYRFNEDWKVFAGLNVWYMDYRNENPDRTSGLSCGDAAVGVGWKMFYVKATYWFRPDPRVLTKGSLPYNYSERMVYSAGVRFAF